MPEGPVRENLQLLLSNILYSNFFLLKGRITLNSRGKRENATQITLFQHFKKCAIHTTTDS